MAILLQFAIGLVFGAGLLLSGMSNPAKVLNFLDLGGIASGNWDPSLAIRHRLGPGRLLPRSGPDRARLRLARGLYLRWGDAGRHVAGALSQPNAVIVAHRHARRSA